MTVYIDMAAIPYRRMKMSHMVADSDTELHEMAHKVGLKREWFQHKKDKPWLNHYDICQTKKKEAHKLGAIEIRRRKLMNIINRKKQKVKE